MNSKIRSVDVVFDGRLDQVAEYAQAAEAAGVGGMWTTETGHDAIVLSTLALAATETLKVATGIVIGLARSPMTIAHQTVDMQDLSGGRFALGLGSQIKPHITRRYSMPWSKPVAQMRELVQSIRAIWDHWYDGEDLNFVGEHYQLTFNASLFRRHPLHPERAPILLAAVGPAMMRMTADQADGFICHPFMNEQYYRNVIEPVLREGARSRLDDFMTVISPNVVIEDDSEEAEKRMLNLRNRMAAYGSTPAYRGVLEEHGLGDFHTRLNLLSKENKWREMGELMTDDVMALFCIRGDMDAVVGEVLRRYGDLATTIKFPVSQLAVATALRNRLALS